jgi:hypothetical protein
MHAAASSLFSTSLFSNTSLEAVVAAMSKPEKIHFPRRHFRIFNGIQGQLQCVRTSAAAQNIHKAITHACGMQM